MGNLVFQAASGGQVAVSGPNTASSFTIAVPAVSGTFVTTGDTGTVTTTMLASTTGSGAVVLATSPTLVTPALGTPSAIVLTNATGLPNSGLVNSSITIGGTSISLGGSSSAITNDITIHGLTVGLGGSSVSSNTAVGASALAANTSGSDCTALGLNALASNNIGINNTASGRYALTSNTSGVGNTANGYSSLATNILGSYNTAYGGLSLYSTTGSYNTSVGYQSLQANTASNNTAVGYQAGYNVLTNGQNTFIGNASGYGVSSGAYNVSLGSYSLWSGAGSYNVAIGYNAGYNATSASNTFIGQGAGYYITSGAKNTVLGNYNGNQGGLDIRTGSNFIVLSDGDGNVRAFCNGSGYWAFGGSSNLGSAQNSIYYTPGTTYGLGFKPSTNSNTPKPCSFLESGGAEVGSITTSGSATLYNVTSDQRLKENIVNAPEFGEVIDSLQVRSFDWKTDGNHQRAGFIAQELVIVAPEAVYQPSDTEQMMAVDYSKLVPMLVKEIQSLRNRLKSANIV